MKNEWITQIEKLHADVEKLSALCLSHGLISRGKFASLLNVNRCDVDQKMKEISRGKEGG